MNEENQGQQLNIELNDDTASGVYSNFAVITHSNTEFILDFIQVMPGVPKARVRSRVIMAPQHAKRLLMALKDNVTKFESSNGKIADLEMPQNAFPMNFGGPKGSA